MCFPKDLVAAGFVPRFTSSYFVSSKVAASHHLDMSSGPTIRALSEKTLKYLGCPRQPSVAQSSEDNFIQSQSLTSGLALFLCRCAFNNAYTQLLPTLEGIIYSINYLRLLVMQSFKSPSTIARLDHFSLILKRHQTLQHLDSVKSSNIAYSTPPRMTRPSALASGQFELIETPAHSKNALVCLHHWSRPLSYLL